MPRRASAGQMSLPVPSAHVRSDVTAPCSALGRPPTAADVLTAGEVAELLHVPRSTVEDWARRGVIPSRKVGRRRLYLRPSIETLLLDGRPQLSFRESMWYPRAVPTRPGWAKAARPPHPELAYLQAFLKRAREDSNL